MLAHDGRQFGVHEAEADEPLDPGVVQATFVRHYRQLPPQLTGAASSWAVQKSGVTILR